MALRSVMASRIPMVVILGATGTGKTKLGVEIAQKFATEIISADSMQIYKGLDVVTAKASAQERAMARHHLLDILEPHQVFTVVDFRNRALKIIDNLLEQGKMPLIVGGTSYYIESIVYQILVEDMDDDQALLWDKSRRKRDLDEPQNKEAKKIALDSDNISEAEERHNPNMSKERNIEVEDKNAIKLFVDNEKKYTNEEVHLTLKAIDPVMAARLHPNNRRKILRSIEVYLKAGRRHSEVLAEQKQTEGNLRRPGATIILWLQCEQAVHDARLNERVDQMIKDGLIQELLEFHERHNQHRIKDGTPPDYTKGIFQTLGFKEFHNYLMLTPEDRESDQGKKLLEESIEEMKRATRRYARKQYKTVRGRFLEHPNRQVPPIYVLDATDISKWDENVKNKAIDIIQSYVNNTSCTYQPLESKLSLEARSADGNSHNYCEVCERLILGDNVYAIHLNSNRHMKMLKRKKKHEKSEMVKEIPT